MIQPMTEAEKTDIIKRAGPFRTIQFYFARFDNKGRASHSHGRLRAVSARIISNYDAKRI